MEHSRGYVDDNAWVALTDGRYKYIYFTLTGKEQLFDLKVDPDEMTDLSQDPRHAELRRAWRGKMVDLLKNRGSRWVKGDQLQVQKDSIKRGPNFPGSQE